MDIFDKIGVAGDWHGNKGWSGIALARFAELGIKNILQLGDFGFWSGNSGQKYLYKVNKRLELNEQTLFVTLGNHEDYVQVARFQPYPHMDGWVYDPKYPNIVVAQRGTRWEWNGVTFVSLGGGNSIDYMGRTEWLNWWKAERISLADVYNTVAGGYADVMVAHDAPYGVNLFGSHRESRHDWLPTEMKYAQESRMTMRQAVDGVKPKLFLHGHYHFFANHTTVLNDGVDDYTLHSVGLDMDGSKHNLAVLHLPSKNLEMISLSWEAISTHYK